MRLPVTDGEILGTLGMFAFAGAVLGVAVAAALGQLINSGGEQ